MIFIYSSARHLCKLCRTTVQNHVHLLTAVILAALSVVPRPGLAVEYYGSSTILASDLSDPRRPQVYNGDLYFAENTFAPDGTLKKIPTTGGNPMTLVTGASVYDSGIYRGIGKYTVNSSGVYGDYGGFQNMRIFAAPSGGSATTLASISGGAFLGVVGNDVYFSSGFTHINKVPTTGGPATEELSGYWVGTHAEDNGQVFFNAGGQNTGLLRFDAATASVATLSELGSEFASLTLDANNLYWSSSGNLLKMPRDGGPVTTLVQSGDIDYGEPYQIVSDGQFVYFSNSAGADPAIQRVPIEGGVPVSLAALPPGTSVRGIAVDQESIYWTEPSSGTIRKLSLTSVAVPSPLVGISGTAMLGLLGFIRWQRRFRGHYMG